jgi:hypothetical protein
LNESPLSEKVARRAADRGGELAAAFRTKSSADPNGGI